MIIHILVSITFFFVLMYLSVNLLGYFVRGIFSPDYDKLKQEQTHEFMKKEVEKIQRADKWITVVALILIVGFLYSLLHFWNVGVMAVAVIIMAGRLPDLLWEIKHGKKTDPKLLKKNALYYISAFLPWVGFPVLYYSLYIWR